MKKKDITYLEKIGELKFDLANLQSKSKVFVFLEGESDVRLFRKLFNNNCTVENIPGGNMKVEQCVQELLPLHLLVIGIRDADFLHLADVPYSRENVFLTDFHDIEMMIFCEDQVFSSLISEHTALSKDQHSEARNVILNAIKQIGYLKFLNQIEALEFKFESAGFRDLISFENGNIDIIRQYLPRLLAKSPEAQNTDIESILVKINLLEHSNSNLYQLCNGHDFLIALSEYLKQVHKVKAVDDKHIVSSSRIAYTINHYQNSRLYQITQKWADDNHCIIY